MTRLYICIAICVVIWIANGISVIHGIKKRIPGEIFMHTGLGLFLSLLTIELSVGLNGAWNHFNIFWLSVIGWILYIPSFILIVSSIIALKHKSKSKGADFTESTLFIDSGIYGYIRQPMTLGAAVWSIAFIMVFQSVFALIIGLVSFFCFRMSAVKESEYDIKKFGDQYNDYMKRVPVWNIFKGIMKQISILKIFLIISAVIILTFQSACKKPSFKSKEDELQFVLTGLVSNDKSVRNCVLAISKGDGSFYWSGAAGIADEKGATMSKDTPICIASITKMFTASVIMILHEKGQLSLDDPMSKYLPDKLIHGIHVYKDKDYSNEITIKQLLSHTSGIPDYLLESPENEKSYFELFIEEPDRKWSVKDTIRRAAEMEANFPPGTDASYSDTNFQLLGKIIEAVTNKPLYLAYEKCIFQPLGLKHTWLTGYPAPKHVHQAQPADMFHNDKNVTRVRNNGTFWADGGIISSAEEMIIFLKALNGGRIISKDTLNSMHDWHKLEFPMQYGYGTMYFRFPGFMNVFMKIPPLWGHSGSTGSFLYYSEDDDLYIAGTINQTKSQSKPFRIMAKAINIAESNK